MLKSLFKKGYSAAAVAAMTSASAATISGSNHGEGNNSDSSVSTLLSSSTIDGPFVPRNLRHFRGSMGIAATVAAAEEIEEKSLFLKDNGPLTNDIAVESKDVSVGRDSTLSSFDPSMELGILSSSEVLEEGDEQGDMRILEETFHCSKCGSDGYDIYKVTPGKYSNFDDLVSAPPGDIRCWDTSLVTDMSWAFFNERSFNQPLHCWDVSNVKNMSFMFFYADNFNQPIGDWDIAHWDVSNVEDMREMFWGATSFNQAIGGWDVSKVQDTSGMFHEASDFNQDIGDWDVSNVGDMEMMFDYAESFNQDIGDWNVANAKDMRNMFHYAKAFNQDIGDWDVSNVRDMGHMFLNANVFNQDIGYWDVSNVRDMSLMFYNAYDFNQCLSTWASKTGSGVNTNYMFTSSGCPYQVDDPDPNVGPWCQGSDQQCFEFSSAPSNTPSLTPSVTPTNSPSTAPSIAPSIAPSDTPSFTPSLSPSVPPSQLPSDTASLLPSVPPSTTPSLAPSTTPSLLPSFAPSLSCMPEVRTHPFCTNDPTFLSKGIAGRDCNWFAANPTERCQTDRRSELSCPEVCNARCNRCDDNPDYRNGDHPLRSCEWIAQKPDLRCSLSPNEEPLCECRATCNPICTTKCKNNKHYRQRGISKRTCNWIASDPKKLRKRCNAFKHEAWFGCPETCNPECAAY